MQDAFRSKRLIFRAPETPDDDDFLHAINSDAAATANASPRVLKPATKKDTAWLASHLGEKALLGVLICLPVDSPAVIPSKTATAAPKEGTGGGADAAKPKRNSDTVPIGLICLQGIPDGHEHHRTTLIGLNILKEYQSHGYGSEAIEWILNWGFKIAGLHRVGIGCYSYNEGAVRLYQRLGFRLECRKKESMWFNGGWHDEIELGMLEREWRESRGIKD